MSAQAAGPSTGVLVLDASALQRRAAELLAAVDEDPKRGAERIAAAEAHVRLVVTGAAGDRAKRLLERAIALDPYRADAYLLLALASHREGHLDSALERYEQAATLAPDSVEIRFHAGYGFLDAARRPSLTDEEAADLAEAASEHFEAALEIDPCHKAAAIGAIEGAIYGKATKLRESLARLFSRIAPDEALRPTVTRLLYQAIFAFRVGKAKGVDQKNRKTMAEIAEVARAWLGAFPADPGLEGVVRAAAIKCETAEEICERLPEHARALPDVRVLRLLLRERLSDVADTEKRFELLADAMERIPPLDGIAHDYLHMLHLVAKRAAAEGDLSSARDAWLLCQAMDPENPATALNLQRLAAHQGDAAGAAQLEHRLTDLWALYLELSPRPELVLRLAAARAQVAVEAEMVRIAEGYEAEQRPAVAAISGLVHRWARAQALGRLAAEPALRDEAGADAARALLSGEPGAALDVARRILSLPLAGKPPVAYAVFSAPKDAADEELVEARDRWRAAMARLIEQEDRESGAITAGQLFLERALKETSILFDSAARAAYDASTCSAQLAELYRRIAAGHRALVELAAGVAEQDVETRAGLAELLAGIPTEILRPYLAVSMKDERWLTVMLLRVRYGGIIAAGWKLYEEGKIHAASDLCANHLAGAGELTSSHRLRAIVVLEDPRWPLWDAVESAQTNVREAIRVAHWTDPPPVTAEMRAIGKLSLSELAQHAATQRARRFLSEDRSRDAVLVLWLAYPGHRKKRTPSDAPVAMAFASIEPGGGGFYAFSVARALRENVVAWYNDTRPSSQGELYNNKRTARLVTEIAGRWAHYALQNIRRDPLRAEAAEEIGQAIMSLFEALKRDHRTIG